jgi:hypothetical protein
MEHRHLGGAAHRHVGGYSLLRLIERQTALTPTQLTTFRAGHAHAGVLLPSESDFDRYLELFGSHWQARTDECTAGRSATH